MNQPEHPTPPIFIHSLHRSGSTYLFNVFRRSGHGYWCYQEPENEFLTHLDDEGDELLEMGNDTVRGLRHPALGKPYFWEFYEIREALSGLFRKSISYDGYFVKPTSDLPEEQSRYFGALIAEAKGRPVLQFCRSAGRIGALKRCFDGIHIHLWREPRNQWWSSKVNNYFNTAILLIYNARELPPVLLETRNRCGIVEFHSDNINEEFQFARMHPLKSPANYFSFYALWLYAYLEGEKHADITISIDKLSADNEYRKTILQNLAQAEIDGLDFSDCSIPRAVFTEEEDSFFSQIELQVSDLFNLHGYNKNDLDMAVEAASASRLRADVPSDLLRDAARTREMTLRYIDQFIEADAQAANAEIRAFEAVVRAKGAEARIEAMENSLSWRITAPLRAMGMLARRLFHS